MTATINNRRLWDSRMQLARIGATKKGGVCRLALSDLDGEALRRIGYAGAEPPGGRLPGAYFEAHIEQGPVLENERKVQRAAAGDAGTRGDGAVAAP